MNDQEIGREMHSAYQDGYAAGYQAAHEEAKALVGELVEVLEDAKMWIAQMREGVDKWSNGSCGLDARCQNMEAWVRSTALPALTKATKWLEGK